MKYSSENEKEIEQLEKKVEELEDKTLLAHINGVKPPKIKQKNKVTLTEAKPGIGNTTNVDSDGVKRCVGCGHEFQTEDKRKPGFVIDPQKQDYCLRCFRIKNYNSLVEQDINDQDFIKIIDDVNSTDKKIRYYYVVDIFDLPGSRLNWLEKLISKKEVVILINKVDLIPKAVSKAKIMRHVQKYFEDSPIKDAKILLTSSVKIDYVYALVNELKSVDYDQYIVGISNAGKSSLINACLKANQQIPSIVTSKYVNTTLDKIKINFTEKNYIFDTPGLVKHNHLAIATAPTYWDFFFFQKEVKQVTYQLLAGQTVFYGGLAWFSFEEGERFDPVKNKVMKTSFHFYVNKQMPLHRTKAEKVENYFRTHRHTLSPRLKDLESEFVTHTFEFNKAAPMDIHISGLGWINFKTFVGMKLSITVPKTEFGINVALLPAMI
ncbi:30S ribosome assembly GTPase [Spiroplasma chinense]|uniref:30S ribosome assembly GTPase n=1 Tax=Spiroplasma chinense TaxID=216932 RepID=A0A5B9Y4W9_9MOLU|nr:ribosome biogenesis GTPase YqeH [Spiroplasma chinense]QEH61855.1 30S ribosome assembly GTPase [Spiroplasma chinense]